jgi:hypothetical protein
LNYQAIHIPYEIPYHAIAIKYMKSFSVLGKLIIAKQIKHSLGFDEDDEFTGMITSTFSFISSVQNFRNI